MHRFPLAACAALTLTAPLAAQHYDTPADSARHALLRLGYGPTPGQVEMVVAEGVMPWIARQLTVRMAPAGAAEGRRDLRTLNGELVALILVRATASDHQLAEVLVDFWTNHFNVFLGKGLVRSYAADYLEHTIRPRALGRFEDLLVATATSPAMLFYLDNAQSVADQANLAALAGRARRPGQRAPVLTEQQRQRLPRGLNENYARELLELHTLGVDGGYTQDDVIGVARILTGWTIDRRGDHRFQFLAAAHDRGEKVVLGRRFPAGGGEDEGRDLLAMLARHPATMHHVSAKLCARFVADIAPDGCIDDAVRAWKASGGEIRAVMEAIVRSPDFWAPVHRTTKTKTPLEFVASAVRAVGGTADASPRLALQLARLGQPLLQQATPNGYPETSADWVNSGALLARMNFAVALASGRLPGVTVDLDRVVPLTRDPEALLDRVDRAVLGGTMSARTRAAIRVELQELPDPRAARAMAVGLALGGPDFQRQ